MIKARALKDRFLERILIGDDCWEWIGTRSHRYGVIGAGGRGGKLLLAHRVSYELFVGPIGKLKVCHHCDNPPCVRPAHFFLGTAQDNALDAVKKKRHMGTRTPPKGEKNHKAKLTQEKVDKLRREWSRKRCPTWLARQYGISRSTLWKVLNNRTWIN